LARPGLLWGRTCENFEPLDVRHLHRAKNLLHDHSFRWAWTRGRDNDASVIHVRTDSALGSIMLTFHACNPGSDCQEAIVQRIPIVWTPCYLGGRRPWFACSGLGYEPCGRRVAVLYWAGDLFACRHCYGLDYQSRHQSPSLRAISRAQKVRERLGASPDVFDPLPYRPKHMHRTTYRRLKRRAVRLSGKAVAEIQRSLGKRP
jgi:hypothetical protein